MKLVSITLLVAAFRATGGVVAGSPQGSAYSGPFTQLTDSFLNVTDLADGFGPEDKLQVCQGQLVFIDLDLDGDWFAYAGGSWATGKIAKNNQCPVGGQLFPRSNGYTVGTVTKPGSQVDRMLVIGGDQLDQGNVFYSDDCGRSFTCSTLPEVWSNTEYRFITHAPPIGWQTQQTFFGGGLSSGAPSWGYYMTLDGGLTWNRPQCASPANCQLDCKATGGLCTITTPDPVGSCNSTNPYWNACQTLPDLPGFVGAIATDWTTLWQFLTPPDDGMVWRMTGPQLATGWELTNATWGGYGKKVFIKGGSPGTGCWFSTDYLAQQTWLFPDSTVNSMNDYATAPSPWGPWTTWSGIAPAPWQPRATAALTAAWDSSGTAAYFASGMTFVNGAPSAPTFGDAWQIDAGVCLLSPSNGKVCSGPDAGTPDLNAVTCNCNAASQGDALCGSCTLGTAYGFPDCQFCPTIDGSPCGLSSGRGTCNSTSGCVCNPPFAPSATGNCDSCEPGNWGPSCAQCPACGTHGVCSGSGTGGGTGRCVCNQGWSGTLCGTCAPGYGPPGACNNCTGGFWGPSCSLCPYCGPHGLCSGSGTTGGSGLCICYGGWTGSECQFAPPPPPSSGKAAGPDAGAVAAGVIFGLLGAAAIGVFVYARFFGGGPRVAAAWAAVKGAASSAVTAVTGGGKASERASLIRTAPASSSSAAAAKARFAPIGASGDAASYGL